MINAKMSSSILSKGVKPPRGPRCAPVAGRGGRANPGAATAAFILQGIYHCPTVDEGGGGGRKAERTDTVRARVCERILMVLYRGGTPPPPPPPSREGCRVVFVKQLLLCPPLQPAHALISSPYPLFGKYIHVYIIYIYISGGHPIFHLVTVACAFIII